MTNEAQLACLRTEPHYRSGQRPDDFAIDHLVSLGFTERDAHVALQQAPTQTVPDAIAFLPPTYASTTLTPTRSAESSLTDDSSLPNTSDYEAGDYPELYDESSAAAGHDVLPEYRPRCPERAARDERLRALKAEREAALADMYAQHRQDQARKRDQQRGRVMNAEEKWSRWSAKFYLPMMKRWG